MTTASAPLGFGTVSLGLHPVADNPRDMLPAVLREALIAEAAGFEGVTISEHHAGAAGYFPNPLLVSATLLSAVRTAWVAACPVVLPLRHPAAVVEDVAYLAAGFPGRFGFGIAPGWAGEDFDLFGIDAADRRQLFEEKMAVITGLRDGHSSPTLDLLRKDPLVNTLLEDFPRVISAAGSVTAARRAARAGFGMILSQFMDISELSKLIQVYRNAGGPGPVILIRRFWLGTTVPEGLSRMMSEQGAWVSRNTSVLAHGEGAEVADQLCAVLEATGADALNLRVHFPGMTHEAYTSQVERCGEQVLSPVTARIRGRARKETEGGP